LRVALLYNEAAGGGGVTLDRLREAIGRHGHQLVRAVEVHDDPKPLVDADPELLAAAGGDGTVASAARLLVGGRVPLAILPTGTANNVARSIGSAGSLDGLIRLWDTAIRVPFDIGVLEGRVGPEYFVEGIGCGLVPSAIDLVKSKADDENQSATSPVSRALRRYSQVLSRLTPQPWTVVVDGVRRTGEFLLVEVLNIPSIGPNLVLCADANPSDGMFSVVTAGEEHRDALAHYISCRLDTEQCLPSLPTVHGRRVALEGAGTLHVDDQLTAAQEPVSIRIDPGALEVLV
jgi:diacylglycerol kinase family enzyme